MGLKLFLNEILKIDLDHTRHPLTDQKLKTEDAVNVAKELPKISQPRNHRTGLFDL